MPAKKKTASAPVKAESGELSLIRKLAEILNETGLSEIELDHKGARVRVSRQIQAAQFLHHGPPAAQPVASVLPAVAAEAPSFEISGTPLKSPMVGTAYLCPTPEAPVFAAVGSNVKQGQTLLIIDCLLYTSPSPRD